ncbi:MAG: sigma-70 family RNA polymerase sigma factor [Alphaproteobacteria bacterium]|nr:sigma-70 family RNA polymerase sigma factor [Alphaproteobacteria bacterium]
MPDTMPEIDDQTDDEVLLTLIKEDNQTAYRILVDRYLGKLWRLGVNVLGNESEAEEVVQESLLTVWKNRKNWEDGSAKFSTWVYRITLNRCIDLKRRRRPTTDTQNIEQVIACEANPAADSSMIRNEQNEKLLGMMDSLPENQKNALILFYYEELSIKEISDRLSTTEQGVRSLLKRGRKNLRELINEDTTQEYRQAFGRS